MNFMEKLRNSDTSAHAIITLIVVSIIALFVCIGGVSKYIAAESRYQTATSNFEIANADTSQKIASIQKEKIVVDTDGEPDENLKQVTNTTKTLFATIMTYNSGKKYEENRQYAKTIVHDETFFDKFLPEDKDVTGDSMIDALHSYKEADSVDIYQTGDNSYYVMVGYIPYTKPATLANKSILKREYAAFEMNATPSAGITKLTLIEKYDAVN